MEEHGGLDTDTWGCLSSFILFLIDTDKWILRKLLYYRYTIDALDFFFGFVAAGIGEVNCWKTRLSLLFWSPVHYPAITRPMLCALRTQRSVIPSHQNNVGRILVITDGTKMEPAGMFFVSVACAI